MAKLKITRADWQKLAADHLAAAQALLAAGCWGDAYYLAGYAVECGLKACIIVRLMAEPEAIFEERRFGDKCWSHELLKLAEQAGIDATLRADRAANPLLNGCWDVVENWDESSRYEPKSQSVAEQLVDAIGDPTNGVMQWMRNHW